MRSLRGTLSIGLIATLVLVFGVQWSMMRSAVDAGLRDIVAHDMEQDADELYGSLVLQDEASLALAHFDPAFLAPGSGRYYQISVDGKVALRSPSLVYATLPRLDGALGERVLQDAPGPNGQALLMLARRHERQAHTIDVLVAADLAPAAAQARKLRDRFAAVTIPLFGMLVALQIVLVRFALTPLRRAEGDVSRLERGEIDQLSEAVPREALPLVRAVNRLLTLTATRLQRSRAALGNVAHALKGPLTLLAQVSDDESLRDRPQVRTVMLEQVEVLRERIDSELRRARVAGAPSAGGPLRLEGELEALVATVRKLYRERALEIDCRVDPSASVRADREDLLELAGNLLDNACKWARSRVRVSVDRHRGTVIAVEDDGPGCPDADLEGLARRGVRMDEQAPGHGLGLAIIRSIAHSYGATLELGRSAALGGFRATVRFPGPEDAAPKSGGKASTPAGATSA